MKAIEEMRLRATSRVRDYETEMKALREKVDLETCTHCKFWRVRSNLNSGNCRRYAPRPGDANASWPITRFDDLCSEWVLSSEIEEDQLADKIKQAKNSVPPKNCGGK